MKLCKFFLYVLAIGSLWGHSRAIASNSNEESVLIIGCRPWDTNAQGFSALGTAHFVDFQVNGAPDPLPPLFHHLDVNDNAMHSSGRFSAFAASHREQFQKIIVDWITYHHIRREAAWEDFASLLSPGGSLIIPVTGVNMIGASISREKAQALVESKLKVLFIHVDILDYSGLPTDSAFDFLRRPSLEPGRLEQAILPMAPVVIVATKKES